MSIKIKHRWEDKVVFESETAKSVREAVLEAVKKKANLSEADLSWANLSEANLSEADLSKADLSWANLSGSNYWKTNLWNVKLTKKTKEQLEIIMGLEVIDK